MKRPTTRVLFALLVAWVTVLATGSAFAQQSAVAALGEWIGAIDASPDWSAAYRDLAYDPASDSTVLSGLTVRSTGGGFSVDFDTVTVTGLTEAADGSMSARRLDASGGVINAGMFSVALSDVSLDDFALPEGTGFTWDPSRPFTSMIHAYEPLARIGASGGHIQSLKLTENVGGVATEIDYDNIALKGWADGKIASLSAGPLAMDAPSELPLITLRVAKGVATDIDIGAFLHIYDPDNYVGGVGDRTWRSAIGSASYDNAVVEAPGAKLTIGSASLGNLRVRQPQESFAAMFDAAMLNPFGAGDPAAGDRSLDLASAFSIGQFAMKPIDIEAIGFDRLHLDDLSITDLSIDGLGAFAIDGFDGEVNGQASIKVGRLAFGGVTLPTSDTIATAMRVARVGGNVDFSSLLPTLGFVETGDVDADIDGIPRTKLGKMRVDLGDYVGSVPTSVTVDIANADFATSMIAQELGAQPAGDLWLRAPARRFDGQARLERDRRHDRRRQFQAGDERHRDTFRRR